MENFKAMSTDELKARYETLRWLCARSRVYGPADELHAAASEELTARLGEAAFYAFDKSVVYKLTH